MKLCKVCGIAITNKRTYCGNTCKFSDPEYNEARVKARRKLPQVKAYTCDVCGWGSNDTNNVSGVLKKHFVIEHKFSDDMFYDKFPHIPRSTRSARTKDQQTSNIMCGECGERINKITNTHLRKHNMTMKEYRIKHGGDVLSVRTKQKQSKSTLATQIHNIFSGKRLPDTIAPEFTPSEYTGVEGQQQYKFSCRVCHHTFVDHLDDGNMPICRQCDPIKEFSPTGKAQVELYEYIRSIYIGTILRNDRKIIKPKELDIVLPDLRLAIEYNGLYWHSETLVGRRYHIEKTELARAAGYRVIHIFEDEWVHNKELVKNKISHLLGQTGHKIHARRTTVAPVPSEIARQFLAVNHLQGSDVHYCALGLYHDTELVALSTFARPRIALGHSSTDTSYVELSRYCTKLGTSVVGGLGKLIAAFRLQTNATRLISYADLRYTTPDKNVYTAVGFTEIGRTPIGYWYFKTSGIRRIHRFGLTKKILTEKHGVPMSGTEYEMARAAKFDRIWDCGHIKYELTLK